MASSRRLSLDAELRTLLGTTNVYFQPPKSISLRYPCIIYSRQRIISRHADNKIYLAEDQYTVTYISKNPDDPMVEKILHHFPGISMDRVFAQDNLYHNNYSLHY